MQVMETEIQFLDPDDIDAAIAALSARGFSVEILDWVDEYEGEILSPAKLIKTRGWIELDQGAFLDWIMGLVTPLGGFVGEAYAANAAPTEAR